MRGGCEAEFAIALEGLELGHEVQTQTPGISGAAEQMVAFAKYEGKSRHALDALIGGGNQAINSAILKIHGNTPETAHGIHDEHLAMIMRNQAKALDGI